MGARPAAGTAVRLKVCVQSWRAVEAGLRHFPSGSAHPATSVLEIAAAVGSRLGSLLANRERRGRLCRRARE